MKTKDAPQSLDDLLSDTYALLRGASALRCLRDTLYEATGGVILGRQEREHMVFMLDAVAASIEACAGAWIDQAEVGTRSPG